MAYKLSFLPSVIKLWNQLPIDFRNEPSLSIFNNKLKIIFVKQPLPLYYDVNFTYGRLAAIHHTRLRLNFSTLNAHLFKINCPDTPLCLCGKIENIIFY